MDASANREYMLNGDSRPRLSDPNYAVSARLHDNNFDALRLILAWMVVLFHIGALSTLPSLHGLTHISGSLAVQSFFVISGFLVTMSYENSASIVAYAEKRLRRIAPAYVAVVLASAVLLAALSTLPPAEYFLDPQTWRFVGYHLIFAGFKALALPGVFTSNPDSAVDIALWTIKVEVSFYIAVPIVVWLGRRFGHTRILGLIFVASIVWRSGMDAMAATTGSQLFTSLGRQLPGWMSFFAGGAWSYYRLQQGKLPSAWLALAGVPLYWFSDGPYLEALQPAAVTLMVSWLALAGPRLPAVGRYGDFSYGTYLYHCPIVQTCIATGLFARSPWLGVLVVVAVVAVLSVVSWYLIESRILRRRSSAARPVSGRPSGSIAAGSG